MLGANEQPSVSDPDNLVVALLPALGVFSIFASTLKCIPPVRWSVCGGL